MYAVIRKTDDSVIYTCNSKEAAIVAAQLEKSKVGIADRQNITAVVMDDGGFSDIMFYTGQTGSNGSSPLKKRGTAVFRSFL